MASPQPVPTRADPVPSRFSAWSPGAEAPRPPSLLAHLRVRLGMAGLAERSDYEHALWRSGKAPGGGRMALHLLKVLGILALIGGLLGLVALQRAPARPSAPPVPPGRAGANDLEVYFVIDTEPGARNEPLRFVGGRVGMRSHERP